MIVSFKFDTSAVFVKNVEGEFTTTDTLIAGKLPPLVRLSDRVQIKLVAQALPEQLHPVPLGVVVRVTPLGSGSVTTVLDDGRSQFPTFLTMI